MCVFVVRTSKNTGVMFLCEVALGKENTITKDNPSLKKAPAGFDSVVARGLVEPGTVFTPLLHFRRPTPRIFKQMRVSFSKTRVSV